MSILRFEAKTKRSQLVAFLTESNLIENIRRDPTEDEITSTLLLLESGVLSVEKVQDLVEVYQPGARLREHRGMDVRVGDYVPPRGGAQIRGALRNVLQTMMDAVLSPYELHCLYEDLHPFTDGNGRSGRALWAWMMIRRKGWEATFALPFLHRWYYQSLDVTRDAKWEP